MNKAVWILLIVIAGLLGYGLGWTAGAGWAIEKGVYAASVVLDIEIKDKVKGMIVALPELMNRIPDETKAKLGLNETDDLDRFNASLNKIYDMKYPNPLKSLKGGVENG